MEPFNRKGLTSDEINEIEEKRIIMLNEAGIDEESILGKADKNMGSWEAFFNENKTMGKDDMKFATRDQWTSIERTEFTRLFKVCFTANKILDTINKICGEQRKNKPDLMVRSINGKASQKAISLREDLVRSISYQSQNDLIYQHAFRMALLMGWGCFQVDIDYESPKSFNKIIKYKTLVDPLRASWDPAAMMPHKGDGDFCAYQYVMGRDEFSATYPYILNPQSFGVAAGFTDTQYESRDTITICDYFVKEWFTVKIFEVTDGMKRWSVTEDEWEEMQKEIALRKNLAKDEKPTADIILGLNPRIINERITQDYHIMRFHLLKNQIIDFTRWPSKYLPIIFVDGNSDFIEGKQYTNSYVHQVRDVQKYMNFILSERATEIKNRRKEQWLATPDNIIGNEQQWRNPETQLGALIAKPDAKTGSMPIKTPAWELSGELLAEYQSASQDLREIMGFNEAQEIQGRDISGKARRERKLEGSMACYIQFDNLSQAIAQSGRVVLDLLPYVIGEDERHMVISRKDGKTESLIINKSMPDGSIENKLEDGDFDIEISTGPSFAVQKEVALEFLQETIGTNPQTFPLVADIWASNLDLENRDQLVERFKTMVPPQVLAKEEGKEMPPQPPSPQEQMMQMEMQLKQAELKEKQDELRIKMEELELKKQKHALEQTELQLKAQKQQMDSQLNIFDHQSNLHKSVLTHSMDKKKAEMDYAAKIAKIVADSHHKSRSIHQSSSS